MLREVFSVVVFCRVEYVQWDDLSNNGFIPNVSFIEFFGEFFGNGFLLLVVLENSRTVLCTYIYTLLVQCCWFMNVSENRPKYNGT